MKDASKAHFPAEPTDSVAVRPTTKNLSPKQKHERTRSSFSRKVEIMEIIWKHGNPAIEQYPKTLEELRAWEEPEKGVYAWKSKGVDEPKGRHHDLRDRYVEALRETNRVLNSKSGENMAAKIRRQDDQIKALLEQNTVLVLNNHQLTDEINRLKTLMSTTNRPSVRR
jgi:hypothetical protein